MSLLCMAFRPGWSKPPRYHDRTGLVRPRANALTGAVDLNTLLRRPGRHRPRDRSRRSLRPGPDRPLLLELATERWFHAILTLDVDVATGAARA